MEKNYLETIKKINELYGKLILVPFGATARTCQRDIFAIGTLEHFDAATKTLYIKNAVGRNNKEYDEFKKPLGMFSFEEIYNLISSTDQYFVEKYKNSKYFKTTQSLPYKTGDKLEVIISKTPKYKIFLNTIGKHSILTVSEHIYKKLKQGDTRNFSCTIVDVKDIINQ